MRTPHDSTLKYAQTAPKSAPKNTPSKYPKCVWYLLQTAPNLNINFNPKKAPKILLIHP